MIDDLFASKEGSTAQSTSGTTNSNSILGKASTSSYLTKFKTPDQLHMLQYSGNRQKLEQTQSDSKEITSFRENNSSNTSFQYKKPSLSPTYSSQQFVKLFYQNATPSTLETPSLFDQKKDTPSLYALKEQNESRVIISQSLGYSSLQKLALILHSDNGILGEPEGEKAETSITKSYEDYYAEYLRWSNMNKKEMSEKKAKLANETNDCNETSKQQSILEGTSLQETQKSTDIEQKSTDVEPKRQSYDKTRMKDVLLQQAGVNDALKEIPLEENKIIESDTSPPPKQESIKKIDQKSKLAPGKKVEKQSSQSKSKGFSYVKSIEASSNADFLKYCNTSRSKFYFVIYIVSEKAICRDKDAERRGETSSKNGKRD